MRVRLQDIARDLNLSTMTISRVLRGHADVSAKTKTRVLQRVAELKYRPNSSARGLRTGNAFRVGILVSRLTDSYDAAICQGLTTTLQAAGYGVGISTTEADSGQEDAEIENHLSRHVDALFLVGTGSGEQHTGKDVPLFCIGRDCAPEDTRVFDWNQMEIGRQAAAHLLARRARAIAYLRGPRTASADERLSGFLRAHREAKTAPRLEWVREMRTTGSEYSSGRDAVTAMLNQRIAPDAVMANTDALALGARDAALAHGLAVPGAFQIIGCGDSSALCKVGLSLTSVSFPGEELGARAGSLALKVLAGDETEAITVRGLRMSPSIVSRATTRELTAKPRRGKAVTEV